MVRQRILDAGQNYAGLERYLEEQNVGSVFLVCGGSFHLLRIGGYLKKLEGQKKIRVVMFSDFTPNPTYESVVKGVGLLKKEKCDLIMAVGGGSAMDVAKCIKLFWDMDPGRNYLEQAIVPNGLPLLAVPTTAGTGSEATRYAVIYYKGEKQSVTHEGCIPGIVLMDPSALETLPDYQRKATMLDAFCHAAESFWSVNSTEESRKYSKEALELILEHKEAYLQNKEPGNRKMLLAANIAGKAINITQTTAGHAMCYKLTSLYGLAHGHAAALCVAVLWPHMLQHTGDCIDPRGKAYLEGILAELAHIMGRHSPKDAGGRVREMLCGWNLEVPAISAEDYEILKKSVNPVRFKNHPVRLTEEAVDRLYHEMAEMREGNIHESRNVGWDHRG